MSLTVNPATPQVQFSGLGTWWKDQKRKMRIKYIENAPSRLLRTNRTSGELGETYDALVVSQQAINAKRIAINKANATLVRNSKIVDIRLMEADELQDTSLDMIRKGFKLLEESLLKRALADKRLNEAIAAAQLLVQAGETKAQAMLDRLTALAGSRNGDTDENLGAAMLKVKQNSNALDQAGKTHLQEVSGFTLLADADNETLVNYFLHGGQLDSPFTDAEVIDVDVVDVEEKTGKDEPAGDDE